MLDLLATSTSTSLAAALEACRGRFIRALLHCWIFRYLLLLSLVTIPEGARPIQGHVQPCYLPVTLQGASSPSLTGREAVSSRVSSLGNEMELYPLPVR